MRSSILGTFICIIFLFYVNIRNIVILALFILITLIPTIYIDNPWTNQIKTTFDLANSNNEIRLFLWKNSYDIANDNLYFGVGSGNVLKRNNEYRLSLNDSQIADWDRVDIYKGFTTFENSYLNILIQNGLLYFMLFFGFIAIILFRALIKLRRIKDDDRFYAHGIFASLISFLFAIFFFDSMEGSSAIFFFVLLFFLVKYTDSKTKLVQE